MKSMIEKPRPRRAAAAVLAAALLATPLALPSLLSPAPASAAEMPGSFADLVSRAKPAVVTVLATGTATRGDEEEGVPALPFGPDSPFRDFFERHFGPQLPGQPRPPAQKRTGLGSGFVIDPAGVIVTNNHVVADADTLKVVLEDGSELEATLLGRDAKTDLAVLKVDAGRPLPTVPWGDSDTLRVGDWVVAIGNPFGLGGSVTAGIVSARGRDIHAGPYDDFIQVDAAINRGNSGGPLFDTAGQVVGVNTAIFSPNGGNIGLGFAIPSRLARQIVAELQTSGGVTRGFIGVSVQPVTPDIAAGLGLPATAGALVAAVYDGGAAKAAGVRPGDVLLRFGPADIKEPRDLSRAVAGTAPGTNVRVTAWRAGGEITLGMTVEAMPDEPKIADTGRPDNRSMPGPVTRLPDVGMTLGNLSDEARARFGIGEDVKGVLVTGVDPAKPAAEKGLRPGDVIVAVGQSPVATTAQAEMEIGKSRAQHHRAVLFLVQRGEQQLFVAVPFAKA